MVKENFYKIIVGEKFLGVASSYDLRKYYTKRNGIRLLLSCLEDECQYIQLNNDLFHDDWMRKEDNRGEHTHASVIEITEEQFEFMNKDIDDVTEDEISEWSKVEEEIVIEEPTIEEIVTVEHVKSKKLAEMSVCCNKAITAGFDAILSDGISHHFSLDITDQVNLISLNSFLASGQEVVPYHADGEPCKFYSADDMGVITAAATAHQMYHVSYLNSLKIYISSLNNVDDIINCFYGVEIPAECKSEVLYTLEAQAMQNLGE